MGTCPKLHAADPADRFNLPGLLIIFRFFSFEYSARPYLGSCTNLACWYWDCYVATGQGARRRNWQHGSVV
jgi:hypothetical protein